VIRVKKMSLKNQIILILLRIGDILMDVVYLVLQVLLIQEHMMLKLRKEM
jgi:hypothetical protein